MSQTKIYLGYYIFVPEVIGKSTHNITKCVQSFCSEYGNRKPSSALFCDQCGSYVEKSKEPYTYEARLPYLYRSKDKPLYSYKSILDSKVKVVALVGRHIDTERSGGHYFLFDNKYRSEYPINHLGAVHVPYSDIIKGVKDPVGDAKEVLEILNNEDFQAIIGTECLLSYGVVVYNCIYD